MKKIILAVAVILSGAVAVNAQDAPKKVFKPFKGDLAFGLIVPTGSGISMGVGISAEPKYTFFDKLVVGARIDADFTYRDESLNYNSSTYTDSRLKLGISYIGTVEYFFTNTTMRPFVGGGAGLYTFYSQNIDTYNGTLGDVNDNKLGGMVRAGFEVGHFRLGLEYNIVPSTDYTYYDYNTNSNQSAKLDNSYIALRVGAFFGGGRIERKRKHRSRD